ncbi:hypothetical protein [Candidatus Magnetobacterium casense]|uniref:Carboxypeptidase regulatory-like domain-containing protein n=1 Tax=Candidatus Magnetobacterium casense TaxID=1455061 RepID=A0ABS6RU70_9BACT|nr:hypothetical protein [Candidatus Magnetobacterium casensis]MBV6340171.1 hypothetical protein [Candidatus Magnetobacterium casensis]
MFDLKNGNTSAEFKKTCAGTTSESFTFELDSVRNNGKSSFIPVKDTAYLKLFPGGQQPHFWFNMGTAFIVSNGQEAKTEDITFIDSDSSNLQGIPVGLVSWNWIGSTKGTASVTFVKGEVKLSGKVTGILHVSYKTDYDVVQVTCQVKGSVLLTATKGERKGNTTVDFNAVVKQEEVYLIVKYACTGEVQPDTVVMVDTGMGGGFVGTTDHEGKVYLGKLNSGRHTLKMTKPGFMDSDKDTIANDWFDVP